MNRTPQDEREWGRERAYDDAVAAQAPVFVRKPVEPKPEKKKARVRVAVVILAAALFTGCITAQADKPDAIVDYNISQSDLVPLIKKRLDNGSVEVLPQRDGTFVLITRKRQKTQ